MSLKERIYVAHWEGPYDWGSEPNQKAHVLYAMYGSHHLYGRY
jgi:hypothetical protein